MFNIINSIINIDNIKYKYTVGPNSVRMLSTTRTRSSCTHRLKHDATRTRFDEPFNATVFNNSFRKSQWKQTIV